MNNLSLKKVSVNYKGIDLLVKGFYFPSEPEQRYLPDGSGYPGCGSSFDVKVIFVMQDDFTYYSQNVYEIYNSLELIEEIEQLAIKEYES